MSTEPLPEALKPVAKGLREGEPAGWVVVAPTSYGKTRASPSLWMTAREAGVAAGLVHVAPLRSLVEEVYRGHFERYGGALQMHDPPPGARRSPYFLASPGLIVSTLDSFLWNLYRFPVAELVKVQQGRSRGHYYPALLGIYSSVVVFDEAHMALSEDNPRGLEAFTAALTHLAAARVPVVVETATLHPSALAHVAEVLADSLGRVYVHVVADSGSSYAESVSGSVEGYASVVYHPTPSRLRGVKWDTRVAGSWDSVLGEVAEAAEEELVLVVANTVERAARLYGELVGMGVDRGSIVLIHGRLASGDRGAAVEKLRVLREKGRGVVVATQVVEAGVDVNASSVYTEAAPLESLVQRVGRACRRGGVLERCRRRGARVVVVETSNPAPYTGDSVREAVRLLESATCVDWRSPVGYGGCTGYGELVAQAAPPRLEAGVWRRILELYLDNDAAPDSLMRLESNVLCGLYRSTGLVGVYVEGLGWVTGSIESVAGWARRGWLQLAGSGAPLLVAVNAEGRVAASVPAERFWSAASRGGGAGCGELVRRLLGDLDALARVVGGGIGLYRWGFTAEPSAYREGLGLGV